MKQDAIAVDNLTIFAGITRTAVSGALCLAAVLWDGGFPCSAQTTSRGEDAFGTAQDRFQPVNSRQIEEAFDDVAAAIPKVDERLNDSPVARQDRGPYVDWNSLRRKVSERDRSNVVYWENGYAQLVRSRSGLESPRLLQLRSSIAKLLRILRAHNLSNPDSSYREAVEPLRSIASKSSNELSEREQTQMRIALMWLADHGQSHSAANMLLRRWSFANVRLRVKPTAVVGESSPILSEQPISGCLAGHRFTGTSKTELTPAVRSIADPQSGTLLLDFDGCHRTRTRTRADRVSVGNQSEYHFQAHAVARLSLHGLQIEPITLTGRYRSWITSIRTPRQGLFGRIERNRAIAEHRETYPQAKRMTVNGVRDTLQASLQVQANLFNQRFRDRVVYPLVRLDLGPRVARFMSDDSAVQVDLALANQKEMAAPHQPLFGPLDDHHFVFQVHESAVQNYLSRLQSPVGTNLQPILTSVGMATQSSAEDSADLKIEFSKGLGLECYFRDAGIIIVIHADEITFDGRRFAASDIRVSYSLEPTRTGGWTLKRHGKPELVPSTLTPSVGRFGIRDIAFRRVLGNVLEREIPQTMELMSLVRQLTGLDESTVSNLDIATVGTGWMQISGQVVEHEASKRMD